jgi:predicted nucleic acid-binding protein
LQPVLFDTSVYISALRRRDERVLQNRNLSRVAFPVPLWLSAVVLEELYAGADAAGRKTVERLEREFGKINRLLVPNLADWSKTGQILSKIALKYDYEETGRARLTNDTLLGTSAARSGIQVLTANERDFARIAEFCPLIWKLWTFTGPLQP